MLLQDIAYSVDVLALQLADELLDALGVGLNADRREDLLDVRGAGGILAAQGEEEVSREVLHFDGGFCDWVSVGMFRDDVCRLFRFSGR